MADEDEPDLDKPEEVAEEEEPEVTRGHDLKPLDPPKYAVRPVLGERFQADLVRDIIVSTMQEQLTGRQYRSDMAPRWAKVIANGVRQRVQDLGFKRYKILVQCVILEMKGAGVKCGQRCLWDPETDSYVADSFRSETLLCHTTVYGVYMY